jgi:hypothetical protein
MDFVAQVRLVRAWLRIDASNAFSEKAEMVLRLNSSNNLHAVLGDFYVSRSRRLRRR